jgi:tetratricopeptide (TPR) repeat protein
MGRFFCKAQEASPTACRRGSETVQIILEKYLIMRRLSLLALGLLIVGLSGCVTPPPPPPPVVVAPQPVVPPQPVAPPDTRTARELFLQALDELQAGTPDKARPTLERLLVVEPNNSAGKNLLQQLGADPVETLGKEYFQYKTQSGDTLSRIAKRFLGDPYKFYILAKYNDIQIPGHLEAGQSIKVPGKRPARMPVEPGVATQAEPDTSDLKLSEAKTLYASSRFQDAINMLEATVREDGASAELKEFLITVYVDYSGTLASAGQLIAAKGLVTKALIAYPDNRRLRAQADLLARQVNVEQTYQAGLAAIKGAAWGKAYDLFVAVLATKPDHPRAKAKLQEIRPRVIEYFHRNATKAYRKQDMDEAISNWDKVLEIDPQNSLAKSNRARAVELKERLKNLPQ